MHKKQLENLITQAKILEKSGNLMSDQKDVVKNLHNALSNAEGNLQRLCEYLAGKRGNATVALEMREHNIMLPVDIACYFGAYGDENQSEPVKKTKHDLEMLEKIFATFKTSLITAVNGRDCADMLEEYTNDHMPFRHVLRCDMYYAKDTATLKQTIETVAENQNVVVIMEGLLPGEAYTCEENIRHSMLEWMADKMTEQPGKYKFVIIFHSIEAAKKRFDGQPCTIVESETLTTTGIRALKYTGCQMSAKQMIHPANA